MTCIYKVILEIPEADLDQGVTVTISSMDEDQLEFVNDMVEFTAPDLKAATQRLGAAIWLDAERAA